MPLKIEFNHNDKPINPLISDLPAGTVFRDALGDISITISGGSNRRICIVLHRKNPTQNMDVPFLFEYETTDIATEVLDYKLIILTKKKE